MPTPQEYRAYFFGNGYLSSIQHGIQAQHATTRMFIKYFYDSSTRQQVLMDYGQYDETSILLNAGYSSEIRDLIRFFDTSQNPYPWCEFFESQDALDGALTTVGIILPKGIHEASKLIRQGEIDPEVMKINGVVAYSEVIAPDGTSKMVSYDVTKWEADMILRLNKYPLAG